MRDQTVRRVPVRNEEDVGLADGRIRIRVIAGGGVWMYVRKHPAKGHERHDAQQQHEHIHPGKPEGSGQILTIIRHQVGSASGWKRTPGKRLEWGISPF